MRFVNVDRDTPLLFPAELREWIAEDHPARFIIDALEQLNLSGFKVNETGSGSERYCYATGRMSSRVIEAATRTDVAVRYIRGNTAHPDHGVLCRFRADNRE